MTLSDDYLVRRVRDHWVVVGPTGLFVVGRCQDDPAACVRTTTGLALELRNRLADVVSWVPFVEPVVVSDGEHTDPDCTVVRVTDLETALTAGPHVVGDVDLGILRHHVPGVAQAMDLEQATFPA